MSRYPQFDLSTIRTQMFSERLSKVSVTDFARPPVAGVSFLQFMQSLPRILAGPEIQSIAESIVLARKRDRSVVFALGGHVIKTGLAPVINALIREGIITCIAVNGAVAIHDCEIALFGRTSEDVVQGLKTGTFGMAADTAKFYNEAISDGVKEQLGVGEALGRALSEIEPPYAECSILACAYECGVPVTVHIALGTDIMHFHPNADGAAMGEGSMRDFRILTQCMSDLSNGGVLLNLGSAVVLPEVLLKAIAVLRNRDPEGFTDFLGVNFDFIQHYRSNQQVVTRVQALGGRGVALTGHHEIMIPLLAQTVMELWSSSTNRGTVL